MNQTLRSVAGLFAALPCPWCFCGGSAIDLFLGRVTRPHKDVDVAVLRRDQLLCRSYLRERGWHLEVAVDGGLSQWPDEVVLELPRHAVWCKNDGFDPPFVEILLNETDGGRFVFRRNRSITLPSTGRSSGRRTASPSWPPKSYSFTSPIGLRSAGRIFGPLCLHSVVRAGLG